MKLTLRLLSAPLMGLALVVFLPALGIVLTLRALGEWIWSTLAPKRGQV